MFGTSPFGRRFGSLFREMEEEMADVERRMNRMLRSAKETSNGGSSEGPFVYGWTVNVGPDGVPRVRKFGNVEELSEGEEDWREPFVTSVFDEEKDVIRVTAELPGVTKETIDIETFDDGIRLEALGEDRKYRTELPIDREIDPETAEARYNNGILEITVGLADSEKPEGHKVDVR